MYAAAAPGPGDRDPIVRAVVSIFGEKVLQDKEPMGLKRLDFEQLPDQQPAVIDKFAAPVRGDASLFLGAC